MSDFPPNTAISEAFYHFNGTTGLADGAFTKKLFLDGVASAVTVTVTEISVGFYLATFIPNAEGFWYLDIVEIADTSARYQGSFRVIKPELDQAVASHLTAGTLGDYINRIKKYCRNWVHIDPATDRYAVYEDNKTDIFEEGDITTTDRKPD